MTRTCPKCGNKMVRDNAAFCDHYGQALTTQGPTGPEPHLPYPVVLIRRNPISSSLSFRGIRPGRAGLLSTPSRLAHRRRSVVGMDVFKRQEPFTREFHADSVARRTSTISTRNSPVGTAPRVRIRVHGALSRNTVSGQMNGFDAMNDV